MRLSLGLLAVALVANAAREASGEYAENETRQATAPTAPKFRATFTSASPSKSPSNSSAIAVRGNRIIRRRHSVNAGPQGHARPVTSVGVAGGRELTEVERTSVGAGEVEPVAQTSPPPQQQGSGGASNESQALGAPLELSLSQAMASYSYYRHSPSASVILAVAYTIVFVVGIVGNSFVVAIVCKSPRMRTVTNYFIVNLAFADILVLLFCLPATLVGNLFIPYVLGLFVCKTVSYLQGVAVSASINTMVAVTMDRFLAICFPMDWHLSRRGARWTIACIWLFSLSISLPWALYFTLLPYPVENRTIAVCAEDWPSERLNKLYFVCANLILLYLFPATMIILCYLGIWYKIERRHIPGDRPKGLKIELIMQKSKIKVVKMMMVVVIIFLLSWMPLYLMFARVKLTEERAQWEEWLIDKMMPLAQWLGASNSCINPILYTFFNRKYKQGFIDLLRFGFCCEPARLDGRDSDTMLQEPGKTRAVSALQASQSGQAGGGAGGRSTVLGLPAASLSGATAANGRSNSSSTQLSHARLAIQMQSMQRRSDETNGTTPVQVDPGATTDHRRHRYHHHHHGHHHRHHHHHHDHNHHHHHRRHHLKTTNEHPGEPDDPKVTPTRPRGPGRVGVAGEVEELKNRAQSGTSLQVARGGQAGKRVRRSSGPATRRTSSKVAGACFRRRPRHRSSENFTDEELCHLDEKAGDIGGGGCSRCPHLDESGREVEEPECSGTHTGRVHGAPAGRSSLARCCARGLCSGSSAVARGRCTGKSHRPEALGNQGARRSELANSYCAPEAVARVELDLARPSRSLSDTLGTKLNWRAKVRDSLAGSGGAVAAASCVNSLAYPEGHARTSTALQQQRSGREQEGKLDAGAAESPEGGECSAHNRRKRRRCTTSSGGSQRDRHWRKWATPTPAGVGVAMSWSARSACGRSVKSNSTNTTRDTESTEFTSSATAGTANLDGTGGSINSLLEPQPRTSSTPVTAMASPVAAAAICRLNAAHCTPGWAHQESADGAQSGATEQVKKWQGSAGSAKGDDRAPPSSSGGEQAECEQLESRKVNTFLGSRSSSSSYLCRKCEGRHEEDGNNDNDAYGLKEARPVHRDEEEDVDGEDDDDDDDDDVNDNENDDDNEDDGDEFDVDEEEEDEFYNGDEDDDDLDVDYGNLLFGSAPNSPERPPGVRKPSGGRHSVAGATDLGLNFAASGSSLVSAVIRGLNSCSLSAAGGRVGGATSGRGCKASTCGPRKLRASEPEASTSGQAERLGGAPRGERKTSPNKVKINKHLPQRLTAESRAGGPKARADGANSDAASNVYRDNQAKHYANPLPAVAAARGLNAAAAPSIALALAPFGGSCVSGPERASFSCGDPELTDEGCDRSAGVASLGQGEERLAEREPDKKLPREAMLLRADSRTCCNQSPGFRPQELTSIDGSISGPDMPRSTSANNNNNNNSSSSSSNNNNSNKQPGWRPRRPEETLKPGPLGTQLEPKTVSIVIHSNPISY